MKKLYLLNFLILFGCISDPICTVNKNNANKQVYDLEEATCFIALQLNAKKSELKIIKRALIAEDNYMIKIGLIQQNPDILNESESNLEMDIDELIEYALNIEKVNIRRENLIEIYDAEVAFLKFIGVVD